MGRGLAILAIFAVGIGACAYWGPFDLTAGSRKPKAHSARSRSVHVETSSANSGSSQAESRVSQTAPPSTIAAFRKSDTPAEAQNSRDAVLAMPPSSPSSPLAALPEKAIPGFPRHARNRLTNDQVAAVLKQAKHLCAEGELIESRDLLSEMYLNNRLTADQRQRVAAELEPIAMEILRSRTLLDDGLIYEVEHGDMLVKIAKPFHVPPEYLMRINGLRSARSIRPRQSLKLVQGPFDVLVQPNEFELTVLRKGKFVRRFAIGVGRDDSPTPAGMFKVGTKLVNPTYYPPPSDTEHRRPVPPGSPDNPLGARWIDIGLGYGIHGTPEPQTVGQRSSRGCIRMRNEDIEELYDMVIEGSRVLIR